MKGARDTFNRIVESVLWHTLTAVKRKRTYVVEDSWSLDGTIALEWQLNGIVSLLTGQTTPFMYYLRSWARIAL